MAAEREEQPAIQRRAANHGKPGAVPSIVREVLHSTGRPLDPATRAFMEPRFGHDFSMVRIHTDDRAAQSAQRVNALAWTVGNDIAFAKNHYSPDTHEGRRTLAHELTHVLQQKAHHSPLPAKLGIAEPATAAERQADRTADAVMSGAAMRSTMFAPAAPSLQRLCGVTDIGTRTECDDRDPVFITGQPLFRFLGGCDDFDTGEEDNLRATAAALPAGGPIEIHGYASVDGDATFNENLSCARALKARTVLTSAGIAAGRITIIKHGPTPGPTAERRSVVVSSTAAPAPTPPAPAPVITSETVETTPGVRTRTDIGVGEDVTLTFSAGVATWATTAGRLSANTGAQVVLTAPDTAQIVGVAAVAGAASASIAFTIIAPTSVAMDREPGTGVKHTLNQPDSGIQTRVHLGPDTVNFHNVIYRERDVAGVPTTPGVYDCNTFSTGHCAGAVGGACPDKAMTNTVIAGMGTRSVLGDCAYSGHCGTAPPFVPGSITVTIPYEYKVGTGAFRSITNVPQVHALAADASTLTSDKAGAHGTTTVAAATTVIAQCP